ncbi:WSC domain-containing protein 2 [Escovopsis weberi]|uniref:WSC domain-containing protein 2 n=1 Tax=Escovopsis weberi TaxID=150374 RepID=A0A0N0RSS9_ESCWE|nr:WSC domain-containing protein 2 [Escovopsis weberi]
MRCPLSVLGLMALLALTYAQSTHNLTIWDDSKKYSYFGCFNETTQIPGSADTRALGDGINESKEGEMTVPLCLAYCSLGATEYRYAGLEWSRECWCSQSIAGIAEKLNDSSCSYPCEGDNTTICGGALKLSVYRLSSEASKSASTSASALIASWAVILSGLVLLLTVYE